MSPEWMEWIEENMPAAMLEEFKAAWRHEGNWRDNRIAALETELAAAWAESRELLTIAHMDGYHRGSQGLKALIINNTILRARMVELEKVREAAAWMRETQKQRNGSFNNWKASNELQEQKNNAVRTLDAALADAEAKP